MDERLNLPSASGIEALMLCPGKWQLERQVTNEVRSEQDQADADYGNKVHAWLAGESVELTPEQLELAEECRRQEREIIGAFVGSGSSPFIFREERLWMHDKMQPCMSGKPDCVAIQTTTAVVLDYKTLYGDIEAAPDNMQLRALAVMVAGIADVHRVAVAIIQPKVTSKPLVCVYELADLNKAEEELRVILRNAFDVRAKRVPGETQCRYCKAKGICQEARATPSALIAHQDRVLAMTGTQLAYFLDICDTAETIIKSARTQAKARLECDAESVPGWKLKPGNARRTIQDISSAHVTLCQAGVPHEEFLLCCSIGIGDAETLVANATGLKGKPLRDKVSELLEGNIETKHNAPSLSKL